MKDFSNLQINQLIVHRVFKRSDTGEIVQPEYSLNPIELDESKKRVIRERLVSALGKNSKSLEMDIIRKDNGSTINLISRLYNCSKGSFTDISKEIAYKLAMAQTLSRIPDCALFIITGTHSNDNIPFSCIVKSESQSAFRLIENQMHEKVLELIDDALLGKDQKLFKIAFISNLDNDIDNCDVIVFDSNLDQFKTSSAAKYFYSDFLGCIIKENSARVIKDFYNQTSDYINSSKYLPEKKVQMQNQLVSYLLSEGVSTVSCHDFANRTLIESAEIDKYLAFMNQFDFSSRSIYKDTSSISKKLKKRYINFSNGIRITGDYTNFDEQLTVSSEEDGVITIKIIGGILNQL